MSDLRFALRAWRRNPMLPLTRVLRPPLPLCLCAASGRFLPVAAARRSVPPVILDDMAARVGAEWMEWYALSPGERW